MRGFLQKLFSRPAQSFQADLPRVNDQARAAEFRKKGNALLGEGRFHEAGLNYREAIAVDPQDALAFVNFGYALSQEKKFVEARVALERALELDACLHDAHFMLGTLAQHDGDIPRAIDGFRQTLKLEPDFELAYRELGYELFRNGEAAEAEVVLCEGLRRFAQSLDLISNLGNLYCAQSQPDKAIEITTRGLELEPRNAELIAKLGTAYNLKGDCARAHQLLQQALAIDPNNADIHSNLGSCLWALARYDEALAAYSAALALEPGHAAVHMNQALTNLLLGNFGPGWVEYEWRFKDDKSRPIATRKAFNEPRWSGGFPIAGKTILLHCEQGFGDTLQFCRYAVDVAALGANVVLQVQRGLGELLEGLPGVSVLVEEGEPLPPFDCHCALMSLPLALGIHNEAPGACEPYLTADGQRTAYWRQRLDSLGPSSSPRIGIVWSGNPRHQRDKQRSIALSLFLTALPAEMAAVCLQPEMNAADLAVLKADARIHNWGAELKNFADTAALIASLDLVVSVDTSVAHLAGALGKPVWVLVTHVPDWRWAVAREDSAWYPSARIFRQAVIGDWREPLLEINQALSKRLARQ